jgi:RNA polymerase sigma factor (sigma-70 family)
MIVKSMGIGMTDTELVAQTLGGDREAFEHIVSRYQSLICSLAYSATGSLGLSQDLAQETFITAWKHLRLLRERHKLRAWLCGIARGLIGKALRREGREPVHAAEPLDLIEQSEALEPLPFERVITQEEEAILWRSLERIPMIYREPLVLFYREHQSVEAVATALDLSEDAVKQRLSRGRKLLHEEVVSFVEGALERTSPGKAFTLGVLAALPVFASSASAASLGVAVAKAGATAKAGIGLAGFSSLAGPFTGFLSGYLGYKMSMEGAASQKERGFIKRFYAILAVFIVVPLALVLLAVWARPLAASHPGLFRGFMIGTVTSWIPATAMLLVWTRRKLRQLNRPGQAQAGNAACSRPVFEYRTRACLLGLPLLHIRLGATWANQREVVKAWIAIADDAAIGGLFAFGGMAIAPICIGGFALGGLVFGGFAAGIACYAGFAVGVWAVGGMASGLMAVGGCAFGWKGAIGGIAIAQQFALGGVALAPHANDELANTFIRNNAFFQNAFALVTKWLWPILLLSLLPSLLIQQVTRKKRQQA